MGNSIPRLATEQFDAHSCIQKLPGSKIVQQEMLCNRRFMKSFRSKRDNEDLVVKVFYTGLSVEEELPPELVQAQGVLLEQRGKFSANSNAFNVLPYQAFIELGDVQAAFLIRQYFHNNLHDALEHHHPPLTYVEKLFVVFQMLHGLKQMHRSGECHGDLKTENIMLTSWNWVFLTDIATFKPTNLPINDPSFFSYFFENANRPACCIAPERFTKSLSYLESLVSAEQEQQPTAQSTPSVLDLRPMMDIFSMGCIIAEIFAVDHRPLFSHPTLLQYIAGEYDPAEAISKLECPQQIRNLVAHMIQKSPTQRYPLSRYFSLCQADANLRHSGKGEQDADEDFSIFPSYFPFLFDILKSTASNSLGCNDADARIRLIAANYGSILENLVTHVDADASDGGTSDIVVDRAGEQLLRHLLRANEDEKSGIFRNVKSESILSDYDKYADAEENAVRVEHADETLNKDETGKPILDPADDLLEELNAFESDPEIQFASKVAALDISDSESLSLSDLAAQIEALGLGTGNAEGDTNASQSVAEAALAALSAVQERNEEQEAQDKESQNTFKGEEDDHKLYPRAVESEGLVIVLNVVLTSLRNVRHPANQIIGLNLMLRFARFVADSVRLQQLIPYTIELLKDTNEAATVRAAGLHTLTALLRMTRVLPKRDQSIFEDYIFPALSTYPTDREPLVQLAFASCLSQIAAIAKRFLDKSFANQLNEPEEASDDSAPSAGGLSSVGGISVSSAGESVQRLNYFQQLENLHEGVKKMIQPLVAQQTPHSSLIKRCLLSTIIKLCVFFGRKETENFLLPLLFTFLNDTDWQLRASLFDHIAGVLSFAPWTSKSHKQILLVMLTDCEELVVARVLKCIHTLCTLKMPLYDRHLLLGFAAGAAPILLHPSPLLRQRVCEVIIAVADLLCPTDVHVLLLPRLVPYIRIDQLQGHRRLTSELLQMVAFAPISRSAFNDALHATLKSEAQISSFRWRAGDGAANEVNFWMRAATKTGLMSEASNDNETEQRRFHDLSALPVSSKSPPSQSNITLDKSASGRPSPTHKVSSEKLFKSMQDAIVAEERSYVQKRERESGPGLPSEAKKLQWLQPYIKGVSNSIKKFSVASKPLREIANIDYAAQLDRLSEGHGAVTLGSYLQIGSGGSSKMGSSVMSTSGYTKLQGPGQGMFTGADGVVRRQIYVASQFFLPQNLKSKSQVSQSRAGKNEILAQLVGVPKTPKVSGQVPKASSSQQYTICLPQRVRSSRAEDETYNEIRRNFNLRVQKVTAAPGGIAGADAMTAGGFGMYRRQQVLLDTDTLLRRIQALDIPPLPQDLGGLTIDTMSEFSKYELMCDVCKAPAVRHDDEGHNNATVDSSSVGAGGEYTGTPVNLIVPGLNDVGIGHGMRVWGMQRKKHLIEGGDLDDIAALGAAEGRFDLNNWVPRGILVHESTEHLGAVRHVEVAEDESFFATGADDGTVKIWLGSRLGDRSLMMSARTIHCGTGGDDGVTRPPAVTALTTCDNSRSVVIGNKLGELGVYRVELLQPSSHDRSRSSTGNSINTPSTANAASPGADTHASKLHGDTDPNSPGVVARNSTRKSRVVCNVAMLAELHSSPGQRALAHGAIVAVEHLSAQVSSTLVYATHNVGLHSWDLRQRREPWKIPLDPELGRITDMSLGADGHWLVCGTSNGFLVLYDLRYQLTLKLWSVVELVRAYDADASVCVNSVKCTPELNFLTNQYSQRPQSTRDFAYASSYHAWENQPIVTVAAGANTVFVVDISTGRIRHTFYSTHMEADQQKFPTVEYLRDIPVATTLQRSLRGTMLPLSYIRQMSVDTDQIHERTSAANAHVARVRTFLTPSRSISSPSGHIGCPAPFIITAGDDRAIRFWNLNRSIEKSVTFSGHGHRDRESSMYNSQDTVSCCFEALDNPSNRLFSSSPHRQQGAKKRSSSVSSGDFDLDNVGVAEGSDLTLDDSGRFRGPSVASGLHEDSILALNMLEPQRLLLSSSRDGAVKVWR